MRMSQNVYYTYHPCLNKNERPQQKANISMRWKPLMKWKILNRLITCQMKQSVIAMPLSHLLRGKMIPQVLKLIVGSIRRVFK